MLTTSLNTWCLNFAVGSTALIQPRKGTGHHSFVSSISSHMLPCDHVSINCGKTALITKLLKHDKDTGLQPCYIDCSLRDVSIPTAFAATLLDSASRNKQLATDIHGSHVSEGSRVEGPFSVSN